MELKHFVILGLIGLTAAFTVPAAPENPGQEESSQVGLPSNSDLASSFPSTYPSEGDSSLPQGQIPVSSEDEGVREKRHLFKWKKGKGEQRVYVDRQYSSGGGYYGNGYRRDVHHHHHYSNPPPPTHHHHQVEQTYVPRPAPSDEYHHYHGGYSGGYQASSGRDYYYPSHSSGGYYSGPPPAYQGQGPVQAAPGAHGHNNVDRGQGAAAVNNIAIIHARAGSTSHASGPTHDDLRAAPNSIPENIDDLISREGFDRE